MTIIPIHDMILLPGISFYFKKEAYYQWQLAEAKAGDELLFLLQKEQKELKDTSAEDFYPIGFSAEVVSIDADGTVQVKVKERVDVYDIENAEGTLSAAASVRPVVKDISQEEKRAKFEKIRSSYLQFVQNFQWGVWARNIILRWGSLEEMICSSASSSVKPKVISFINCSPAILPMAASWIRLASVVAADNCGVASTYA